MNLRAGNFDGTANEATKEAEKDLERIRNMNWKNVKIEDEKPKSA